MAVCECLYAEGEQMKGIQVHTHWCLSQHNILLSELIGLCFVLIFTEGLDCKCHNNINNMCSVP